MREDDLTFVDVVRRELGSVRWPESAEIRARARRRSRRTAAAVAVAVLTVAGGATVAVADRVGGPHVAAAPAYLPGRAEVPADALLTEADLPVRADMQLGETGLDEPVQVDKLLERCAADQGIAVTPLTSRYSRSRDLLRNMAAGQSNTAPLPLLSQDVYRMQPGTADRVFTEVDRLVGACATWQQTTPVQRDGRTGQVSIRHGWQVAARDFAGDRAVLLRHTEAPAPGAQIVEPESGEDARVIVRVGDLVSVFGRLNGSVNAAPGEVPLISDEELLDLARTAAGRMCVAANPGC